MATIEQIAQLLDLSSTDLEFLVAHGEVLRASGRGSDPRGFASVQAIASKIGLSVADANRIATELARKGLAISGSEVGLTATGVDVATKVMLRRLGS
jgi:hypothetical protein